MKGFCLPKAVCAVVHRMKVVYGHSILSQKHITTHMHVILKTCLKMSARHVDCLVRVISHCTNMLFLQAFQLLKYGTVIAGGMVIFHLNHSYLSHTLMERLRFSWN